MWKTHREMRSNNNLEMVGNSTSLSKFTSIDFLTIRIKHARWKKKNEKKKLQRKKNKTKNRIELDNSLIYWPGLNPHFFFKKKTFLFILLSDSYLPLKQDRFGNMYKLKEHLGLYHLFFRPIVKKKVCCFLTS